MLSKEILKETIISQRKLFLDTKGSFEREILNLSLTERAIFRTNEIIIITGVRRCGKS